MTILASNPDSAVERASCSLSASEQARRIQEIRVGLAQRIHLRRDLADGVALGFQNDPALREELEDFVAFESRCCSFARFEIRGGDPADPLWLEIRGGPAARSFVDTLFPSSAETRDQSTEGEGAKRAAIGWGIGGSIASAAALLCCATGVVPLLAGVLGIAGASASISLWVDRVAGPVFLVCAGILFHALWRRRSRLRGAGARLGDAPATGAHPERAPASASALSCGSPSALEGSART